MIKHLFATLQPPSTHTLDKKNRTSDLAPHSLTCTVAKEDYTRTPKFDSSTAWPRIHLLALWNHAAADSACQFWCIRIYRFPVHFSKLSESISPLTNWLPFVIDPPLIKWALSLLEGLLWTLPLITCELSSTSVPTKPCADRPEEASKGPGVNVREVFKEARSGISITIPSRLPSLAGGASSEEQFYNQRQMVR